MFKAYPLNLSDEGGLALIEGEPKAQPSLSFEVGSLKMKNPLMLAAGTVGLSPHIFPRLAEAEAGAVVTKSISVEPREGYRNPTLVEVECGYVNAVGLANPGVKEFSKELMDMRGKPIPIIVSLFGSKPEEFIQMVSILEETPIDGYELNLSCPHVEKVGLEIGQDPGMVSDIVGAAKRHASKPVFAKLSPNVTDIVGVASAAEEAGADGVTAINTVRAMAIDVETGRPILSNRLGGLSGPAVKPVAVRCVYEISKNVDIPVIGCGGVTNWTDAVELMMAGASAVQIGSAVAYRGFKVFEEVLLGIQEYLVKKGLKSIGDIVGISHTY